MNVLHAKIGTRNKKRGVFYDWRVLLLLFFVCGAFFVVMLRMYSLQVVSHDTYRLLAEDQHTVFHEFTARRGEVYLKEKNSHELFPLAVNKKYPFVFVSPKDVTEEEKVIVHLNDILSVDTTFVADKLRDKTDPFEIIQKRVSDEQAQKIQDLKLRGVFVADEMYRYYPSESLASQTIGFVGSNGNEFIGRYGVESFFEDELRGRSGAIEQERDAGGRWISLAKRSFSPPQNGADIVLTIDHSVQYEVERILRETVEKHDADSGLILVMEADTGKMLAMAATPDFDPNEYAKTEDLSVFLNPAINLTYESGSVFKPITMAIGINEQKIGPETTYVDTGEIYSGGFTIKNSDEKAYGLQTMTQVLEESLNTGTIFIVRQVGKSTFSEYVRNFGFGEKTDVMFPAEAVGNIKNLDFLERDVHFYTASFGQGISMTPLQLIRAYGALANGGKLMKPQIVERFKHADGTEKEVEPFEVRRVIREDVSVAISHMLKSVVENGHGKRASVPGYNIGGKTGTAQVAKKNEKGYSEDETIGTFVGYGPIEDPRFVVLTKIDNPKDVIWAESSAAPAFSKVMRFLLEYYEIEPTREYEITDFEEK